MVSLLKENIKQRDNKMTNFKLKSLAAPKSASGSTLTTQGRFAMSARYARLKRELKTNRKLLAI